MPNMTPIIHFWTWLYWQVAIWNPCFCVQLVHRPNSLNPFLISILIVKWNVRYSIKYWLYSIGFGVSECCGLGCYLSTCVWQGCQNSCTKHWSFGIIWNKLILEDESNLRKSFEPVSAKKQEYSRPQISCRIESVGTIESKSNSDIQDLKKISLNWSF